jgi:hypothetical protein
MFLRRVISDAEDICGGSAASAPLNSTMELENVGASGAAMLSASYSHTVTTSMEEEKHAEQQDVAYTNSISMSAQSELGTAAAMVVEPESILAPPTGSKTNDPNQVVASNELENAPAGAMGNYVDRAAANSIPAPEFGVHVNFHERLNVPSAIQSLQRQYYSSSSLSGDEEDDDEPLVKNVVNTGAAGVQQPPSTLSRMHSGSSSQSSSSQLARSSQNSSRDWGWFDDVHATAHSTEMALATSGILGGSGALDSGGSTVPQSNKAHRVLIVDPAENAMAVTAPNYVLEESLSSQFLWKNSAGQRPPQPVEERAFYEKMWAQNFARSNVEYNMPVELLTATSPISLDPFADGGDLSDYHASVVPTHADAGGSAPGGTDIAEAALVYRMNDDQRHPHELHHYGPKEVKDTSGDGTLTVLVRGDNVFGTTVSKSFARTNEMGDPIAGVDTINISIASYRVVESSKHGKYAQFLVIYRQGSIRDTIGVWKRYRDFEELAHKVTQAHEGCAAALANISPLHVAADDNETEHLPNAITSWRLLKKRKRWYRCLDAGYLSLKVFLLERFLHDILFESSSPHLLRDFVGVNSVSQMLK